MGTSYTPPGTDPTGNPHPPKDQPPQPCEAPVEPAEPSAAEPVAEEQAIADATAPAGVPIEVAAQAAE